MEDRNDTAAERCDWQVVEESAMPAKLDAAIRRGLCRAMPEEAAFFARSRAWNGCVPAFSIVLQQRDGEVIAHVGLVDRTLKIGTRRVRVAGIQNVFVSPDARGGGFGKEAMRRAMTEAGRRGFDGGMLFCLPTLEAYYASLGWRGMESNSIQVGEDGTERPIPAKNIAMYFPLALAELPLGIVRLCGNDW